MLLLVSYLVLGSTAKKEIFGGINTRKLTPVMCNSLISACGADGWELALALLKTMDEASLERDLWSFSGAIKACGEAGHWEKALALFTSEALGFNEVMASSMVSACAKAKQWQLTLRLIASMSRLRLANAFSYSAAISGQKSWPWALQLITIMSQASVERDLACRNALYLACQKVGAWQQALPRIQLKSVSEKKQKGKKEVLKICHSFNGDV